MVARRPDTVVGSRCGKRFRPERVAARPGWPALTDGLARLEQILERWRQARPPR